MSKREFTVLTVQHGDRITLIAEGFRPFTVDGWNPKVVGVDGHLAVIQRWAYQFPELDIIIPIHPDIDGVSEPLVEMSGFCWHLFKPIPNVSYVMR